MTATNVKEFIEHHGVKGMRWGVRRTRGGGRVGSARRPSADQSVDRHTQRTTFGKSPSKLTQTQLESRIRRMEMEKRYNELNKKDISQGQKIATEIVTNVGKQVITNIATSTLTGLGTYGVKKALASKTKLPIGEIFKKK